MRLAVLPHGPGFCLAPSAHVQFAVILQVSVLVYRMHGMHTASNLQYDYQFTVIFHPLALVMKGGHTSNVSQKNPHLHDRFPT